MHTHDVLRARLHAAAGLLPQRASRDARAIYESMQKSEWSAEFEDLMRNRLIIGAMRYGKLGDPAKPRWDRVAGIKARIAKYEEQGNLELLVDIANFALLEFVEGQHPLRHFHATDDGDHLSHV